MEQHTCVVCLDEESLITFIPCNHRVCCVGCYSKLYKKECVVCRAKINYIRVLYSIHKPAIEQAIDKIIPQDLESKLYRLFEKILNRVYEFDSFLDMCRELCNVYLELNNKNDALPKFTLTHQQAISLIDTVKGYHDTDINNRIVLYNALVSMCREPWHVINGDCGLCYNGNFGEIPSLDYGIDLLKENYRKCKIMNFM